MEDTTSKRAKLPERHELKYFISPQEMIMLRQKLMGVLRLDPHCVKNGGEYFIRSLYFDDHYQSAYEEKLQGVMNRDKYRIRIYNMRDDNIFLERKRKRGDLIQKSSVKITRRLADQLIAGDPANLELTNVPLLQDMFREMRTKLLKPAVIVDYHREAFIHPAENVRITFDKRLHTGLFCKDMFDGDVTTVSPLMDGREILEIKYDHYLPDYIAWLFTGLQAERSAISKYIFCRRFEPLEG